VAGMRYEVLVGHQEDVALLQTRNVVVKADDEITAAYRAGCMLTEDDDELEVLAIRSEAQYIEEEFGGYTMDMYKPDEHPEQYI
jgi:hypothetical protein